MATIRKKWGVLNKNGEKNFFFEYNFTHHSFSLSFPHLFSVTLRGRIPIILLVQPLFRLVSASFWPPWLCFPWRRLHIISATVAVIRRSLQTPAALIMWSPGKCKPKKLFLEFVKVPRSVLIHWWVMIFWNTWVVTVLSGQICTNIVQTHYIGTQVGMVNVSIYRKVNIKIRVKRDHPPVRGR